MGSSTAAGRVHRETRREVAREGVFCAHEKGKVSREPVRIRPVGTQVFAHPRCNPRDHIGWNPR